MGHNPWCSCALCRGVEVVALNAARDAFLTANQAVDANTPLPVTEQHPNAPALMCSCFHSHAHYVHLLHETVACMFLDESCSRENILGAVDELHNALTRTHCRHGAPCAFDTGLLRRADEAEALLSATTDVAAPDNSVPEHDLQSAPNGDAADPSHNTPPTLSVLSYLWDRRDSCDSDDAAAQAAWDA